MATRNIVPRANEEGNLGTALKNWLKGWFKDLFVSNEITDGTNTATVANLKDAVDKKHIQNTDTQLLNGAIQVVSGDDVLISNNLEVNGNLDLGDDQYLYFDTAKRFSLGFSSDPNLNILLFGNDANPIDFATPHSFTIYSNVGTDGLGNWEPEFAMKVSGVIEVVNTSQGAAGSKYFLIDMTDGVRLDTGGNRAILKADNLAASDKTFQFPNVSGTLVVDTDIVKDFGEIYVNGNTVATTISVQNTWYQFLGFNTNGESSGATPDNTNDHITINKTKKYLVTASISFSGGASKNYELEIKKNNGATPFSNLHTERKLGTTGDIGSVSISGLVSLSVTDTIELWIRCTDTTTVDATLRDVTLSLIQID